jgi:phospholipid-binding lipoprotein MlaA
MTKRGLAAAAMLVAGLLSSGWAAAASPEAAFRDYFEARARTAGIGARNIQIYQRRIAAALSPLVTQAIVRQPEQIAPIMHGLMAAAPNAAPAVARQAMANFPGFAERIAQATGLKNTQIAVQTVIFTPSWSNSAAHGKPFATPDNRHSARIATWAISAIAENPGALRDIMGRALAVVPGNEVALVRAVQTAYPGFAGQIANATAAPRSRPPRSLASRPQARPPVMRTRVARAPVMRAPVTRRTATPTAVTQTPAARQAVAPTPVMRAAPRLPAKAEQLTDADQDDLEINDPLEPMNRIIFAFNDTVDLVLLRPIAIGYNWIMPEVASQAVRRAFLNLDAPVIALNDLLQGDLGDAGVALGRFGINSTIGFLGLLDPAADLGLERHHADFGQTLHSYDVGSGPYLVLPLLGPASTRGGVGKIVDIFFQPLNYLLSTGQNLGLTATRAVVRREELLDPLDELRENSIDYYTGLKAAFWQARQVELNKGTLVGLGDGGADKLFDNAN